MMKTTWAENWTLHHSDFGISEFTRKKFLKQGEEWHLSMTI